MMTREQYLSAGRDIPGPFNSPEVRAARDAAHRAYYGQFVTPAIRAHVSQRFGVEKLRAAFAEDATFNTSATPLSSWGQMACPADVARKMREAGDYPTLAGMVCLLKEAARQIVEEA